MGREVRRGQLISPFGVGAMIEFPGECLMHAGLDLWPSDPALVPRLVEDRLAARLGVSDFRVPPPPPGRNRPGAFVRFVRFPQWHQCPRCRSISPCGWNDGQHPRCASDLAPAAGQPTCRQQPERRRRRMIPLRFIIACVRGHTDDFPWIAWVHSQPGQPIDPAASCAEPRLTLKQTGRGGLMGYAVECHNPQCGARRTLAGATAEDGLTGLPCPCRRPWLGPNGNDAGGCPERPRMILRNASNAYFPKTASAILIPPFAAAVMRVLDDERVRSLLLGGTTDGRVSEERIQTVAQLKGVPVDQLRDAVARLQNGQRDAAATSTSETEFRRAEYGALLAPPGSPEDDFVLAVEPMDSYEPWVADFFERIVLVERLAETRALVGFSRINPPLRGNYSPEDRRNLRLGNGSWLPASRVFGEGVFFTLRHDRLAQWSAQPGIAARVRAIQNRLDQVHRERGFPLRPLSPKLLLLHALSHALIRRMAFECGYGSSSLRERLYCDEGTGDPMAGVLIYTAAGDAEGTMGGLVRQGKPGRFEPLVSQAIADATWCSSDPICVETTGQGSDALNMAACHACLLLPETSCEEGNRLLDRVLLVGTIPEPVLGYFDPVRDAVMRRLAEG